MITQLFSFLLLLAWALIAIAALWYLNRVRRRQGLGAAVGRLCSRRVLLPVVLLLALTLVRASLVFIYPQEAGVVVSLWAERGYRPEPLKSGLHWIVPLVERVERYPIYRQTYTMAYRPFEGQHLGDDAVVARTADGQEVKLDVSVIFSLDPDQVVDIHINWQHRYLEEMIRPGMRGGLREISSQFTVDELNSNRRSAFTDALNRQIKAAAAVHGFLIQAIFIRNITFSEVYSASVEQKQVAHQGRTRSEHEAAQIENLAVGRARKIQLVAEAEADAVRIRAEAAAEARVIQARAEARALELVADALEDRDELLTYRYIDKIGPNLHVMLLPGASPLTLPLVNGQGLVSPASSPQLPPAAPDRERHENVLR